MTRLAKLQAPLPHGLVTNEDAAGRQHLLDHAQAEGKTEIQPHGMADHRGGIAVAAVAGARERRRHANQLSQPTPAAKAMRNNMTMPHRRLDRHPALSVTMNF
jgi:hypothetical protein